MDPLSDIVTLLRLRAAATIPITARGHWGIACEPGNNPGFIAILEGSAWIAWGARDPLQLNTGDFLLFPLIPALTLQSERGLACIPIENWRVPGHFGELTGRPDFAAVGGSFTFEHAALPLLHVLIPDLIHIRASEASTSRFGRLMQLFSEEYVSDDPGKSLIIKQMLEMLIVEALRWQIGKGDVSATGLLNALYDPALRRALSAMHADVRAHWTVAELAAIARMSRSAFAARFRASMGCAPMEYLVRWRMALAKSALTAGKKSLETVAEEIGYESASAFSTAFRKRMGCSPGRYARDQLLAQVSTASGSGPGWSKARSRNGQATRKKSKP